MNRRRFVWTLSTAAIGILLGSETPARAQNPKKVQKAAPALTGDSWRNTPGNLPIAAESRKGKVTIVHFWTFGCINCKHNLAIYNQWQQQFAKDGVLVIGVHTPETESERREANVTEFLQREKITYPVLIDNAHRNWNRWNLQYWPTVFVVDRHNRIRAVWEGELEYNNAGGTQKMARVVEQLLAEKV